MGIFLPLNTTLTPALSLRERELNYSLAPLGERVRVRGNLW